MTFEAWMKRVDDKLSDKIGMYHDGLPDAQWRDWYEDELTPDDAIEEFAEVLRDEFGDLVDALL